MPPERLQISVSGVPQGWTSTIVGGGQPIEAVLPATNASVSFELRLDIPKDAAMGTTNLTVTAKGANTVTLPVAVTLVKDLPAKLTLTPALPELRGTSRSTFEYQLTIKNESGKRIVANLAATAPQNFDVSFTEQYGSQELNAVPLDANQSKDVKLKVRPPNTIGVGPQKVTARATAEDANVTAELGLDITGTPKIELAGRDGRLNAARHGRAGDHDPGHRDQHRHRGGGGCRVVRLGPERLEGRGRSEDDRSHPAEREQGSPVQDHADRQGGGGRLRHHLPRRGARRIRLADLPCRGRNLHSMGPHRRRASSASRCWCCSAP